MVMKRLANFSVVNSEMRALRARQRILEITFKAQSSHIGSAFSVVDILSVLYSGMANISPDNSTSVDRDYILLSKGHAAAALYSVLFESGFITKNELEDYCQNGSALGGHVTHQGKNGVELSTGSLGHGLPYGVGIAVGNKLSGLNSKTYVIMSDGECDEGTTWESALMANQFELKNLVVVIDRNRIQSLSDTESTMALEPLADKWEAFNWNVTTIDGHSHAEFSKALSLEIGPHCIIANTTKGKGVSYMENEIVWHYRPPSQEDFLSAGIELGRNQE
jgi:transketolase